MRLQNDDEEEYGRLSIKMPTVILIASLAIFGVLAVVFLANGAGKEKRSDYMKKTATVSDNSADAEPVDTLTAADLDFWDMYNDEYDPDAAAEEAEEDQPEGDMPEETPEEEDTDPSTDGKHTQVTHMDGSTEWIDINSSLKLNDFDDMGFMAKNGIISYYADGVDTTLTGADISQYTTVDDWDRLATEVDYVMIRVGARGYDTGKIIADTKFTDNFVQAVKHGIPYGLYFSSQAVNETEAAEEASYVLTQLQSARNAAISGVTTTTSTASTANQTQTGQAANGQKYGTTTTSTDADGNTTTIQLDDQGNSITTVKDKNGNTTKTVTVYTDPYGNVTTTTTDADGEQTINTVNNGTSANSNNTNNTNTTTQNTTAYDISFPIAVDMHYVNNDTARIENAGSAMRTAVLSTFCETIRQSGYTPMVMGSKEFLLCQINLSQLSGTDIWVSNEGTLPDYPYQMSMWKYNTENKLLKSLSGQYGVDVSFIDYSAR